MRFISLTIYIIKIILRVKNLIKTSMYPIWHPYKKFEKYKVNTKLYKIYYNYLSQGWYKLDNLF